MSSNNPFFHLKNKFRKTKKSKNNDKDDENINKNIGPYIITNKIREGIYSKIYLGRSKYTNDDVAIKIISKEALLENLEDLSLLLSHIESLKILKHKNIISLYEIYESPKFFYLIMEYFPKKNLLEKIILKKRLSENEALIIFVQILDALIYMHKMNIVHRNIRTDHILFDKNNRPKLTGFNYSTFYEKNKKITGSFGSLCYTCPEILNEEEYNPELADVWSLGVVLYVMLCGFLPFSEENDEKNKELITRGIVEYPKEISNKIKDLLKHMLEVDSNKRFNFLKISKHPWIKKFTDDKSIFIGGINIIEIKYPVDDRILNIIDKHFQNFNKNQIKKNLIENKYNQGTGLYKLLLRKVIDMKINTVSDLFSDDFSKYIMNINNYFNKADKNENSKLYKKYIEKVIDKLNKIGDYIEEYQRKEDDAVHYFLNIEKLKKSIMIKPPDTNTINDSLYSDLRASFSDNMNQNNDLKLSFIDNIDIHFIDNIDTDNEEHKDEELDIDLIKQFKEEQSKKNIENLLKGKRNDKQSVNKKYEKSKSQCYDNKELVNFVNKINLLNRLTPKKSITLESDKIINDIIKEKEKNEDKINESLLYSFRNNQSFFNKSFRKSHIDRGSFLEGYLKKNHPENIRRTLLRYSMFSNISEEEDDDNNNRKSDKKLNENINDDEKKNENWGTTSKNKKKETRYSLSFMDDDDGESEFNESIYLSRNDVKFASEIKDAIRELNALKKKEKEKVKFRGKEKENLSINIYNSNNNKNEGSSNVSPKISNLKEKNKNTNFNINNNGLSTISPKKSNLRDKTKNADGSSNISPKICNFKDNIQKEKEKKVFFSKFCNNNDNRYSNFNIDYINNKDRKENENNFNNNTENKEDYYTEESNIFLLNSNDFSFHEEITENENEKRSYIQNYRRKKEIENYFFKKDKLIISKLSNEFNNKEVFSIINIENKRTKMFVMKFSFDKFEIKKLNIDNNLNNISNINIIGKKFDKNKKYHKESSDILEYSYKERERNNHNNNNILKYQESILNKSNNNLQSEAIINSSNNSYTSIKRNSSTININTNNNNYILYGNNFVMNNEEEDSIVKMIGRNRDSNKDNSFEISDIQKNGKIKKDKRENNNNNNYKKKKKDIFKNLSGYLNKKNESIRIFENEIPDKHKKKRKYLTSSKKKNNFGKNISCAIKKPKPNNLYLSTNKYKKNIKSNQEIRNRSLENKPKKNIKSSTLKNTKNSINKNNLNKNEKKKFQLLQNEFFYNTNHYFNTNNYNTVNDFEMLPYLITKETPKNINKKNKIRYNTSMNKTNKNVKSQIINCEPKLTNLKNISFYDEQNNNPPNETKKNKNNKNSIKKSTFSKAKRNESINNRQNNFHKEKAKKKINKKNKNTRSLYLINPIIIEQENITTRITQLNTTKSKNKKNNSSINKYNDSNNNNIVHKVVKLNKKSNQAVIENMLLKRKEIVKKIRNCKLFMNNLNSDLKFSIVNHTEQIPFPYVDTESIKIINKTPNIKTEEKNEPIKDKDSSKESKKKLPDNNNTDNTNFITIDSITIKNLQNNLDNKFNSSNDTPKKESFCHTDRIFDLNNEFDINIKKNNKNNIEQNDSIRNKDNEYNNKNNFNYDSNINQTNYNKKINILKKIILRNTYNNTIACSNNSSIIEGSDFNDN